MTRKLLPLVVLPLALFFASSCGSSSKTVSSIKHDKMAKIGVAPFQAPRYYSQGEERVGPEAELGQRIVERMNQEWLEGSEGRRIAPVWVNRSSQNLIPALKNGEASLLLGIGVTDELKEEMDFSTPYGQSNVVLILNPTVTRNLRPSTIKGARIAVRAGSAVEQLLKQKEAETVAFDSLDEAVLALKRGEISGAADDHHMAAFALVEVPGVSNLELHPEPLGSVDIAAAVRKGDEPVLKLVNEVIGEWRDQYQEALNEHIGDRMEVVEKRYTDRVNREQRAQAPRQVTIRLSKEAGSPVDIYRFANLSFTFTDSQGRSYSTSRVDFHQRVGSCSVTVPPGSYAISLPKLGFRASTGISEQAPGSISITIRFQANGNVVVS
jgi:ABC-type amino acid transport substrate-binding protein